MADYSRPEGLQLKEIGGFLPRCDCGEEFFFYHKSFCGAHCRQFLLAALSKRYLLSNTILCVSMKSFDFT